MRTLSIIAAAALLPLLSTAAFAECDTELKQSDGYKELSEKLKCLNDEIARLRSSASVQPGSVALLPGEPAEMPGCVKSSTLPPASIIWLRPGSKLCRDDGSIWLRVTGVNPAGPYVSLALPDQGTSFSCYQSSPSCELYDPEARLKFRLQVESKKNNKDEVGLVGYFRKVKLE